MSNKVRALLLVCMLVAACAGVPGPADSIDMIVAGAYVVTMDEKQQVIEDGAVAVDDGFIVAVGPSADILARYRARKVLEGERKVVLPGLVNGHTHAAMTLLRGIADDLELMTWLNKYIFPTEVRFVNEEFVRIGTELACLEMIRGGTTTFVDMYYFPDSVANAVEACGLRVLVAPTVIGQKSPDSRDADAGLQLASDFYRRWHGRNNRIIPVFAPHAIYTLDRAQLSAVRARASQLGATISIHLAESRFEVETSEQRYGDTPVRVLDELGFFAGQVIGAHVIWPSDEEIEILAQRGVGVVHNPTSNMKIASGVAPIAKMLARGVKVGLGTDGAATNNDLDMWEEMRLAAFLQKVSTMDPEVLPAAVVLQMATRGGAEAIGLGGQIGALTVGRRADLIQVSLDDPHFTPTYDIVSHLVYVADEQDVSSVVVDGRVVMEERTVLTLDEGRVRGAASALASRIAAALER